MVKRYPFNIYYSKNKLVWIGYTDFSNIREFNLWDILFIEVNLRGPFDNFKVMTIKFKNDTQIDIHKPEIEEKEWNYLVQHYEN